MAVESDSTQLQMQTNEKQKLYQFDICTFNIWCPYWNRNEDHVSKQWKNRQNDILKILCNENNDNEEEDKKEKEKDDNKEQLPAMNCDIYCIQEYWCASEEFVRLYENYLKPRNYEIHYFKRQMKNKPDGVAIILNKNAFRLKNKLEFKYKVNNRVILLAEVEHKASKCCLMIGVTHLTFPQDDYDINEVRPQLAKEMIELMQKNASNSISAQMLIGDFNCDIKGNEAKMCVKDGYESSFHAVNSNYDGKIVSHFNHDKESVSADHIFYKKNPNVSKENKFTMEPVGSYLYPRHVKINEWPKDWTLSDHRPLVSTFAVKREE